MSSRKRGHRRSAAERAERRTLWTAGIVVFLAVLTYWYPSEDEVEKTSSPERRVSSSVLRKTKRQCRSSCQDVIVSAARGGIVDLPISTAHSSPSTASARISSSSTISSPSSSSTSHRHTDTDTDTDTNINDRTNYPSGSSSNLASSAFDALLHVYSQQDSDSTTSDGNDGSESPSSLAYSDQDRYSDYLLYPLRKAVHSYLKQYGSDALSQAEAEVISKAASTAAASSSSSQATSAASASQDFLPPPPPTRLPYVIEALVGAVDSRYPNGGRIRESSSNNDDDDNGTYKKSTNKIRREGASDSTGLLGSTLATSAKDLSAIVRKGDESAVAMAAAAAAATFWSSRSAHLMGSVRRRNRMKAINEDWEASLRWIAGWNQHQQSRQNQSQAETSSGTGRDRERKKSEEAESFLDNDLTSEEEAEISLLIDICVEECVGMASGDESGGSSSNAKSRRRNIKGRKEKRGMASRTARNRLFSILPGSVFSQRIVSTFLFSLFFSWAILNGLRAIFQWDAFSLIWNWLRDMGGDKNQKGLIGDHRVQGISQDAVGGNSSSGMSKKKWGGGKKTRRRKMKRAPSSSSGGNEALTKKGSQVREDCDDERLQLARANIGERNRSGSLSQNSLTDEDAEDDDTAMLDLVRSSKRGNVSRSGDSPNPSSNNSTTSSPNDTPVQSPTRGKNKIRSNKKSDVRSQYVGQYVGRSKQPTRSTKVNRGRKGHYSGVKHPVPTEEERTAAIQKLRDYQRMQIAKIAQRKKAAAERAKILSKKADGTVSYSAITAGTPPMSPSQPPSEEARPSRSSEGIQELLLDATVPQAAPYSPDGNTPAFRAELRPPPGLDYSPTSIEHESGVAANTQLEAVAHDLLLSGILDEDEAQRDHNDTPGVSFGSPLGFMNSTASPNEVSTISIADNWNNSITETASVEAASGCVQIPTGVSSTAWSPQSDSSAGNTGPSYSGIW